jgi:hypothetical protein
MFLKMYVEEKDVQMPSELRKTALLASAIGRVQSQRPRAAQAACPESRER